MLAILLSHHRTGSTAIRQALGTRIKVCPDEPLLFHLVETRPAGSFDWPTFLRWSQHRYDLIHCHREHVDSLAGWSSIAEYGCRIIHLTRQHRLHQALSYRRALQDKVWIDHPIGHSHDDAIALDELEEQLSRWSRLEAKAEFYFRQSPALHVTYEEFVERPFSTIERIVAFLQAGYAKPPGP